MSKKAKAGKQPDPPQVPTDNQPFNKLWINSCYQDTLLPGAPWHKLEEEISHNLAQKAEKQFSHPQRKEMLLEVLGKHFVEKYLSHVQRNPKLLEPGHMRADEKNRLKIDAQNWLSSQMYKAVKETGHGYLLTGIGPGDPPPTGNYAEFLRDTFSIFSTGLDRDLYIQEKNLTKAKADELNHLKKSGKPDIYKVPAPSRLLPAGTAGSGTSQSTAKPASGLLRSMVHTIEGDPPPLWGPQSDAIGAAVASLLQRDPRKFEVIVGRLHGRQLPGSLRSYIWADVLFKVERTKMKEVYVEKVVRERFALAVTRGLTELRIKKPTQSPINGLIQNAVIETYSKTTSMVPYKHLEHMKETIRALNVLYVYDRSYEPYLVHWLFPIQLGFRNKQAMTDDKGEHVLELAMYLDMLNSNCFPTWPHVFAMAEQVMMRLQEKDPQLYDHLKHIAPINAQVNPKEFLVQLLHQEREKAEALIRSSTNTPRAPSSSTQFLADPTIFLRRWIGEGFVSVLDTPGVMYVWDQLFMQEWQESAIINVCLSLMELLRHRFMEAYDYITMKEVFLLEPCKLYTVDFQMAWIHVENGKDLLDINDLYNRQRPLSANSRMSVASVADRDSPIGGLLKPCGIKNIRTSLTIPSDSIQKEPWLANLKPEHFRLNVGVYFGSIKMRSRLSHTLGVVASTTWDSYGSLVIEFEFPGERYIYDMLDLSQYDVERELGAYPYAIFKLERMKTKTGRDSEPGQTSMGWGRIPLFRKENRGYGDEESFSLMEGDVTVPLHAGDIPESLITAQPRTPTQDGRVSGSLLGYNCTLSAYVFDPNNEPTSRKVKAATPMPIIPNPVPPLDTRRTTPAHPTPKAPSTRRLPSPSPPPLPTPAPQAPPDPEPTPPQPTPRDIPWVAHKPNAAKSNPKPTTNRDPFAMYIDTVRYLPDNATVVKVTGRILRAGDVTNLQDILAVPDLDSSARSPEFNFHMVVNEGRQVADVELLLFLRVYSFDIETKKVVVIGSCLVRVFNPGKKKGEGLLCVGGHQLRLHSGMPKMKDGLSQISEHDLEGNPVVPGCTLLIRLLPQTQDPVPAPHYVSGYYKSETCQPTVSESRIFDSYAADSKTHPKTERDMIKRVQQYDRSGNKGGSDSELTSWLVDKLDIKKQQGVNQPAGNLSLQSCVRYRIKVGLKVQIKTAFGLPDGTYVQCFAYVAPGKQAKYTSATPEGFGKEEKFVTNKISATSHVTAPAWEDDPKEMHPLYDDYSCLIIQFFGLKVLYRPKADHRSAGTVHKPDGSPLEIGNDELIGWAVVPLFHSNSVLSGKHVVPVLTCPLSEDLLEELSVKPVSNVLNSKVWNNHTKMQGASIQVLVWDSHFDFQELPEQEFHSSLLEIVGSLQEYQSVSEAPPSGLTQQEFVLGMMEQKVRKQGVKGTTLKKEMVFFNDTMGKALNNLMTDYCLKNGFAPL